MAVYVYAGIPVADYPGALAWYERLLGAPPSFFPNDREAVWQLAEQGSVYVEHRPERAGRAMHTIVVDDFDARLTAMARRGLSPAELESYENGVRKAIFVDPEGNEIGFGGLPG